jgi:DNA-binding ferritin-like protein
MNNITVQTNILVCQSGYDLDNVKNFSIYLLNIISLIKLMHWYADNYQVHEILGSLYQDLDPLIDKMIEEIIGVVRDHKFSFNLTTPLVDLKDSSLYKLNSEGKMEEVLKVLDSLTNTLSSIEIKNFILLGYSGINNTLEEILSSLNKTKYLLNLVKL